MISSCFRASGVRLFSTGPKSSLKVCIQGAGLSGLTHALALQQIGVYPTVIEAHSSEKDIESSITHKGFAVCLTPNTIKILTRLGVVDEVFENAAQINNVVLASHRGEKYSFFMLDEIAKKQGHGYWAIEKSKLRQILRNAYVKRQPTTVPPILYGNSVLSVSEGNDSEISLKLKRGAKELQCDVLVGADGANSKIRPMVCDGAAAHDMSTFGMIQCYNMVMPMPSSVDPNTVVMEWENGKSIVLVPCGEKLHAMGIVYTQGPVPAMHSELFFKTFATEFEKFKGSGVEDVIRLVSYKPEKIEKHWTMPWQVTPPSLVGGEGKRVVLMGDAAHNTLPILQHEHAMGIEDGWVLANCIQKKVIEGGSAISAALEDYSKQRLERIKPLQDKAMSYRKWTMTPLKYPITRKWMLTNSGAPLVQNFFRKMAMKGPFGEK